MKNKTTTLRDGTIHNKIINGCWQLSDGHGKTFSSPTKLLSQYIVAGYSTFDGADIYTGVEEIFGNIPSNYLRNIRFHTKHVPDLNDIQNKRISKEKTISLIKRSCNRMKTETLSNVQFHWWDYKSDAYKISLGALIELQQEGVIKHIGVTNTNLRFLSKLEQEFDFIPMTSQNQYSIIDRRVENNFITYLEKREIGLYCYGSLMGGLLSSKYLNTKKPKEPLINRSLRKYLRILDDWADWATFQKLLQILHQIGIEHNASISEIAISWVLHQKGVNSVILGIRNSQNFSSLERILDIELTKDNFKSIDYIYLKGIPLKGDVFDLERYEPRHKNIMKYNLNTQT